MNRNTLIALLFCLMIATALGNVLVVPADISTGGGSGNLSGAGTTGQVATYITGSSTLGATTVPTCPSGEVLIALDTCSPIGNITVTTNDTLQNVTTRGATSTNNITIQNLGIGEVGYGTNYMGLKFSGLASSAYAFLQDNLGSTYLNRPTGQSIYFRQNNGNTAEMNDAGTHFYTNVFLPQGSSPSSAPSVRFTGVTSGLSADTNQVYLWDRGFNVMRLIGASGTSPLTVRQGSNWIRLHPATGTANTNVAIESDGAGVVEIRTNANTGAQTQLRVTHTASAVNRFAFTGSTTGQPIILQPHGNDANINIQYTPKGTGNNTFSRPIEVQTIQNRPNVAVDFTQLHNNYPHGRFSFWFNNGTTLNEGMRIDQRGATIYKTASPTPSLRVEGILQTDFINRAFASRINPFIDSSFLNSETTNFLHNAEKRFNVTLSGNTTTYVSNWDVALFDGNYDQTNILRPAEGEVAIVTIDLMAKGGESSVSPTTGLTYGQSVSYISGYHTNGPKNVTIQMKHYNGTAYEELPCVDEQSNMYWSVNPEFYHYRVWKCEYPQRLFVKEIIYTMWGRNDSGSGEPTRIVEIEMHMLRPSATQTTVLSKYQPDRLYQPVAWYNSTNDKIIEINPTTGRLSAKGYDVTTPETKDYLTTEDELRNNLPDNPKHILRDDGKLDGTYLPTGIKYFENQSITYDVPIYDTKGNLIRVDTETITRSVEKTKIDELVHHLMILTAEQEKELRALRTELNQEINDLKRRLDELEAIKK
jgi:hypothetical protein